MEEARFRFLKRLDEVVRSVESEHDEHGDDTRLTCAMTYGNRRTVTFTRWWPDGLYVDIEVLTELVDDSVEATAGLVKLVTGRERSKRVTVIK